MTLRALLPLGDIPPDVVPPCIEQRHEALFLHGRFAVASRKHLTGGRCARSMLRHWHHPDQNGAERTSMLRDGGDVALSTTLDRDPVHEVATWYFPRCWAYQRETSSTVGCGGSGMIAVEVVGWDATLLPLRDDSVDVIISNLPFGQRCLSSNRLPGLLLPLISEIGRVLRRQTGWECCSAGHTLPLSTPWKSRTVLPHPTKMTRTAAIPGRYLSYPLPSVFPMNVGFDRLDHRRVTRNGCRLSGSKPPGEGEEDEEDAESDHKG